MKKKNFWIKLILAGSALGIMNHMFFKLASYKYKRIQKNINLIHGNWEKFIIEWKEKDSQYCSSMDRQWGFFI